MSAPSLPTPQSGKIVDIVKVLPGGRVTIPKDVREILEMYTGARLVVIMDEKKRMVMYQLLSGPLLKETI